ncbi:ATP-binding protein [Flexilinea flocculi]|uniref:Predicted ATPase, AAA+ superfamily n=1 Tax=Flexilinea flocculi TaxID=1678840 RepID=A0A0K8PAD9_9CHLR|nr:ATP-binding protein [Flexilinea flocculi]GAP39627.1 predicted ATPase, AAA+ superfamily [Flexilinea flocculi]
MIKRTSYLQKIHPFIGLDLVKVLTGIRRSGKSVMLSLIMDELREQGIPQDHIVSLNFENFENNHLCTAEKLHTYVSDRIADSKDKYYLFFDEIQEVERWEKGVNSLRVKYGCDIYITGSNAKLLSGELATYLAGRYVEIMIYPFSFAEFCDLYLERNPQASTPEIFNQYIRFGGMPFLANLNFSPDPSKQYLQDVYNSVVLKDVVSRNNIRDTALLNKIITYVMANIGQTFSATSISKYFKNENRIVSPETILNYLQACEDAFLFFSFHRQDLIGKKILTVNDKYYMADHGIREAVYGKNERDINQVLENIVAIELLRRGWKVTIGKIGSLEIDFVCEKQEMKQYIQVVYLLASQETIDREFGSLEKIPDNYPKYVISMDEFDMSRNGITHMNLRNFLLQSE